MTSTMNHLSSYLVEKVADDFYREVEVFNTNHPNAVVGLSKDLAMNAASHALANTKHFEDTGGMDIKGPLDAATRGILDCVAQAHSTRNVNGFRVRVIGNTNRFHFMRARRVRNGFRYLKLKSWTGCFELLTELAQTANRDGTKSVTVFPQSKDRMHTVRVSANQFESVFEIPIDRALDVDRVIGDDFEWYVFFFPIFALSFHLQFYSSFHVNVLFLLIQARHKWSISANGWYTCYVHSESCKVDFEIQDGTGDAETSSCTDSS